MKVDIYDIPENYYYIKEHEWILIENTHARIGVTDYGQKALREVTYFYAGNEGVHVKRMETICEIETVKCVAEILSPLSGEVLKFNESLFSEPNLINREPYGRGWIAIIRPTNFDDELEKLLKPDIYAEYIKELVKVDETLLIHKWRKGFGRKNRRIKMRTHQSRNVHKTICYSSIICMRRKRGEGT